MASVIEALLVESDAGLEQLPRVPLNQGWWLLPVVEELKDLPRCDDPDLRGFLELKQHTVELGLRLSAHRPVVYLHLEYHGGFGFQAAVVWNAGEVVSSPFFTANHEAELQGPRYVMESGVDLPGGAVNSCLRLVSVEKRMAFDEFEAIGLNRYKWNKDWLSHAEFPCVVCGGLVFNEPVGSYAICPVCGWEDDPVQAKHPRMRGGANGDSIADYQHRFATWNFSDCERERGWRLLRSDEALLPSWEDGAVDYSLDFFKGRPRYYWRL